MDNYSSLLALVYFKEKDDRYSISELMQVLGCNAVQIDDLISSLIEKGYLEYQKDLLKLSNKGLIKLIAANLDDMVLRTDKQELKHIQPDKAVSFDEVYVPNNFQAKV